LFDAPQGVDDWRDALRPDRFRTPRSAGRVKSAALYRAAAPEPRAARLFAGEHGEEPPFDATEHCRHFDK